MPRSARQSRNVIQSTNPLFRRMPESKGDVLPREGDQDLDRI